MSCSFLSFSSSFSSFQVFPDHQKWAFDPPDPPPVRGEPLSPSHSNKPPFLSPQKYKNQFLKPIDNAAIWQQEVHLLPYRPSSTSSHPSFSPFCYVFNLFHRQVNVAGKVTGVYMPIIRRQQGSDTIPRCDKCILLQIFDAECGLRCRYLDDSRADNEHISSIPKVRDTRLRMFRDIHTSCRVTHCTRSGKSKRYPPCLQPLQPMSRHALGIRASYHRGDQVPIPHNIHNSKSLTKFRPSSPNKQLRLQHVAGPHNFLSQSSKSQAHTPFLQLLSDGPDRPPPSRHDAPTDACALLNRDCLVCVLQLCILSILDPCLFDAVVL